MMRRMFSVGLAGVLALCVAGAASAATSVDLVFVGSGTSVTNITAGFAGNITMRVLLTSDDNLIGASSSVEWDNAGTTAVAGTTEWSGVGVSFTMMVATSSFTPISAWGPASIDNVARQLHNFDGVMSLPANPPNLPNGTYQIGTVVWSTTGASGSTIIDGYIQFGVDGFTNGTVFAGTLNSATINVVVPEPGTASLLGLGLIGLIMAGRRNRA